MKNAMGAEKTKKSIKPAKKSPQPLVVPTKRSQPTVAAAKTTTTAKTSAKTQSTKRARKASTSKTAPAQAQMTTKKFAEGLSFQKLFFIFLIGSVIGTIYEDILIYLQTYFDTGTGVWMLHRGVIYGPFNVIYGFGAAVMCWVLLRKKYNNWQIFGLSAVLGGVIEYVLSFLQETFTHTTSWDYSGQWLDLNGRTSVPLMIVWGFMGLILVKWLYPILSHAIEKIPIQVGVPLFWTLLIFMIFNCLVSWTAVIRQTLRHNDIPPFTPIGEFYDYYYNDDYLRKYFPNMVRQDGK